ncbi:MAG TPA: VOC family protein [Solirubrobacteraceae bacterium]
MRLDGLHHITMITGDAQRNVDFYAELLGLRLVKTTVNFDAPEAYHLYFGDETGSPGSILTWFEFTGAARGRPGAGMIHTLQLGVAAPAALDFWAERLSAAGVECERDELTLRFADYDGLALELVMAGSGTPPLVAVHPEVPPQHALIGPQGARAYGRAPVGPAPLLTETLGFDALGEGGYRLAGEHRRFEWAYDDAPAQRGSQGAGTVHHIAWACPDADQPAWQQRVRDAGAMVTDVRDRDYFKSIYFREPRGILFEIATLSPGFAVDEDPDHLGEALKLPRMHEHLRPELERTLTPLVNPRARRRAMQA